MLDELKMKVEGSIGMMCDNQAAIAIAKNHVHHDRTKHVEINRHFISEKIERKIIPLKHVPSQFRHQIFLLRIYIVLILKNYVLSLV